MEIKERVKGLIRELSTNTFEREDIIALSMLSVLSGEHVFLYGPPGVAKSMIARRIAKIFKDDGYFEYLIHKFSTPEEIFGPISLKELKNDNYVRKTQNYLPDTKVAFLDEIFKASPAILNTLLTIINERLFRNGKEIKKVPLRSVISASNEIPSMYDGLEALYDRFLIRIYVLPIQNKANFERFLIDRSNEEEFDVSDNLKITDEEWNNWQKEIQKVFLSKDTINFIHTLREKIEELNKKKRKNKNLIYISDRRWKKIVKILKASAFFCGRKETNLSDHPLIFHMIWRDEKDIEELRPIFEEVLQETGFELNLSLENLIERKSELEEEIKNVFYYLEDIYDTVEIDGKKYLKFEERYNNKKIKFLIPLDKLETNDTFHPLDENLNPINYLRCNFNGTKVCKVEINRYEMGYWGSYDEWEEWKDVEPPILHKKGSKKSDIPTTIEDAYIEKVDKLIEEFKKVLQLFNEKNEHLEKEIDNPFITRKEKDLILKSVKKLGEKIKQEIKDCERIKSLI